MVAFFHTGRVNRVMLAHKTHLALGLRVKDRLGPPRTWIADTDGNRALCRDSNRISK
jgi:hypothetical protein